jgi:hypothetical protein
MVDGKELECAAVETNAATLMRFAVSTVRPSEQAVDWRTGHIMPM